VNSRPSDAIVQEITIHAPAERVFGALINPASINSIPSIDSPTTLRSPAVRLTRE
jgi:hypothetical protein